MSYVKDKDAHTRGVGAIAAADARDPRATRQKRMTRALATERRDMRMAALPTTLGAINFGGGQRWLAAHVFGSGGTLQGGGGIEGGGQGLPGGNWGGWTGPRGGAPGQTPPGLLQKLLGTTSAFKQMAAKPFVPGGTGNGFPQPVSPPRTSGGIPVPTDPGSGTGGSGSGASSGGGSGGGGSGGGGGGGQTDDGSSTDTSSSSSLDALASQVPGGKATLLVGAAAVLYLIFRKKG